MRRNPALNIPHLVLPSRWRRCTPAPAVLALALLLPQCRPGVRSTVMSSLERMEHQPRLTCGGPLSPRRLWHVVVGCGVFVLLFAATLIYGGPAFGARLLSSNNDNVVEPVAPDAEKEAPPKPELEFYSWHTRSQFRPVNQAVAGKSAQDLCDAFPKDLLRDVQPILKSGHGVLEKRVKTQLESVSACLDDHLLIFSDVDEKIGGYQVIDVLADLRTDFVDGNDQLQAYVLQKELADNGTLHTEAGSKVKGWETDKFKFLPQVSRAWRMRPEKRWYVFYEDDTYIVWDNIFRLLTNFDPDMPWYFGSPSPGARGFWMANGGPGYVLSREALRRLAKDDFDDNGAFAGSALTQRWEDQMMHDCCGDSVLGLALHEDAQTGLSGLFPMFQPHPLHGVPLSDTYWCQPVISMHKTSAEDMVSLRKWEESRRIMQRPLLFADLVEYLNLTEVSVREDWINSDFGGYRAPGDIAHTSFEACGEACRADSNCLQWTHHLRDCTFVPSIRLGQSREPGIEGWRSEEEKAMEWGEDQRRYKAGWDLDGIKRWMSAPGRDCKTARWVRPSLKRIF